jgi:hypothetical protein
MTLDKVTSDVTYQGFTLQELVETNRRYQSALERAAKENLLMKAALNLALELSGHKNTCKHCSCVYVYCGNFEQLNEQLDEARLKLHTFYQGTG